MKFSLSVLYSVIIVKLIADIVLDNEVGIAAELTNISIIWLMIHFVVMSTILTSGTDIFVLDNRSNVFKTSYYFYIFFQN